MSARRLLYVMDPMCSWCWGFAPVANALVEQAQAAGVDVHLVVGGLRTGSGAALEPTTRRYILEHWQAVTEATGQPFKTGRRVARWICLRHRARLSGAGDGAQPGAGLCVETARSDSAGVLCRRSRCHPRQCSGGAGGAGRSAAHRVRRRVRPCRYARRYGSDFTWVQDLGIAGFPTLLAERNGQLALLTNGYQQCRDSRRFHLGAGPRHRRFPHLAG